MKEQVVALIMEIKKGVTIDEKTNLIFDGVLSSLEIIMLITAIEEEFKVKMDVSEVTPDNFETVDAVVKMIERLKG